MRFRPIRVPTARGPHTALPRPRASVSRQPSASGSTRSDAATLPSVTEQGEPTWISIVEAARIAGCNPGTINRYVRAGRIVSRGGRRRPGSGNRGGSASLRLDSVEEFATWWQARRQAEAERTRARRLERATRRVVPPDDSIVWLTMDDAAAVLGVSRVRVGQLVRAGRIPAISRGRRHWLRREDVERLAAARVAMATRRIGWPIRFGG